MRQSRRERFILDVRRAARLQQHPSLETVSDAVSSDAIARVLHGASAWLSPKVVEEYLPDEFAWWQKPHQEQLHVAVEEFRQVAQQVAPGTPATIQQFRDGADRFSKLLRVLGEMVLLEWSDAIRAIEDQVMEWAGEAGWRTRRVNKKITESLLGVYDAPQLLIFAEPNLCVLDPIARFVLGGLGSFDLSIQPSYETTSLYRDEDGNWFVHLEVGNGVSKGKRVPWTKDTFLECIQQLKVLV